MSKKIFNPEDWQTKTTEQTPIANQNSSLSSNDDIEEITKRIESAAVDIAPNYADWRDLGFALADALGENGRSYYQRLSQFYPSYTETETNKQFDNCLKSHGHGITIKTLFHFAKLANINIAKYPNIQNGNLAKWQEPNEKTIPNNTIQNEELEEKLPVFPAEIYNSLPDLLRQITGFANSPEDADLLLLGSLTVFSSCFANVFGVYGGVTVYPNLFLFVSAQASAGKGRLSLCRRLVEPIHKQLRELNKAEYEDYKHKQAEYVANKKDPDAEAPEEPPLRVLFIPANSSATAVFQILNENQGVGLIFETEGDTLAQTFKSEHGNYSDGFRKAFHHEKISYLRRKDREYVTLELPKLSALLSGTPRQVQSLIPDAENGLFSRFIFYYMNIQLKWINVFANSNEESLDIQFDHIGEHFFDFYKTIKMSGDIRFSLTKSQQTQFNTYFEQVQKQYWELLGDEYIGTVRRLGLILFRIAMILTILRIMDTGDLSSLIVCADTDFHIALEMIKVLVQHASFVFSQLPKVEPVQTSNPKMAFYQALPTQFDRAKYLEIAKSLEIPESTADKQIARFIKSNILVRNAQNNYIKPTV